MTPQSLSQAGKDALADLVQRVYNDLSHAANIRFFVSGKADVPDAAGANQVIDAILDTVPENRLILDSIAGQSVVYAIWVRTPTTGEPALRYIGHVVSVGARTRMINHFVRKDPRTGAKLDNVRAALAAGYEVGVSFVAIDPPAVRLYVEEMLIQKLDGPEYWNQKSRIKHNKRVK